MICFCVHSRWFFAHIHIFSLFFRVFVIILDDLGGFYENLDVVGDLSRLGGRNREFLSALAKITAKILIFSPFLPQKRFQKSRLDGLRQNEMPFFLFCPAKITRFLAQKSIFWAAWVGQIKNCGSAAVRSRCVRAYLAVMQSFAENFPH